MKSPVVLTCSGIFTIVRSRPPGQSTNLQYILLSSVTTTYNIPLLIPLSKWALCRTLLESYIIIWNCPQKTQYWLMEEVLFNISSWDTWKKSKDRGILSIINQLVLYILIVDDERKVTHQRLDRIFSHAWCL